MNSDEIDLSKCIEITATPVFDRALIDKLRGLGPHLKQHILGQDPALDRIIPLLQAGELGLANPKRPKSSFLFVGPTGVGKTETAICFTEYLFGPDHLVRFDMSEFQNQSSVDVLLGQHDRDRGLIGRRIGHLTRGTLLFDEMEKAHPLVLDLFLQILDAARITFATSETLDLSGFYVVFTSNIGAPEAARMRNSAMPTVERAVLRRIEQLLRAEFLGRIQAAVVFHQINTWMLRQIGLNVLQSGILRMRKAEWGIGVQYNLAVIRGPGTGGRGVQRSIEVALGSAAVQAVVGLANGA